MSELKRSLKRALQRVLPSDRPPVLIASMGRSGSTLVYDAVRLATARARFPAFGEFGRRLSGESAMEPAGRRYSPGVVYKTHALAAEFPADAHLRAIFLFGAASDAALSVLACEQRYGRAWIDQHFEHLRATGPYEDLPDRDVLRFEEQVRGWMGRDGLPRLILRYDAIWDHVDELSEFVGLPIEIPERRARGGISASSPEMVARVRRSYARLDDWIAGLPDCQRLA